MRKQDQDEGLGHPLQRDKLEQRYRGKTQFQEDCFQPEYKYSAGMGEEQLEGPSPNLCDHMDYKVHGILQARILELVSFPFSRGSSQPRD